MLACACADMPVHDVATFLIVIAGDIRYDMHILYLSYLLIRTTMLTCAKIGYMWGNYIRNVLTLNKNDYGYMSACITCIQ